MPKRFLIESSVARSAIGIGSPAQIEAVSAATDKGHLTSSTYLRMEFIRGMICAMTQMAAVIRNCDTCEQASSYLSQDFSTRDMKVYVQVAGMLLDRSVPRTPTAWAETIASEALRLLRRFDRVLKNRIKNKSACQIGGGNPEVDYDTLIDDLNAFCREFLAPVQDCEINGWLDLTDPQSEACLMTDRLASAKIAAIDQLRELRSTARHITCRECSKIGDAVIALEQPNTAPLVYSDNAFDTLCADLSKPFVKIPSVVTLERGANPDLPSL
jgi:hypothetical protein